MLQTISVTSTSYNKMSSRVPKYRTEVIHSLQGSSTKADGLYPNCERLQHCQRYFGCRCGAADLHDQLVVAYFIGNIIPDILMCPSDEELCTAAWEKCKEIFMKLDNTLFEEVRLNLFTHNLVAPPFFSILTHMMYMHNILVAWLYVFVPVILLQASTGLYFNHTIPLYPFSLAWTRYGKAGAVPCPLQVCACA